MISYGAQSVQRELNAAGDAAERYNLMLEPLGATVDEIALLVGDSGQLDQLDKMLSLDFGWERFNVANDEVKTQPIRSAYEVEYHFFRKPGVSYRLEVMRIRSGISPLHVAIPLPLARQVCTLVHASFRCPDELEYAASRFFLEDSAGMVEAQRCDSTYGRFSYFTDLKMPGRRVPYLKPRVNLRDA